MALIDTTGNYFLHIFIYTAISCQVPQKDASNHGEVSCSGGVPASYGASCTWTCDDGFYSPTTSVTCGDNDADGTGDFDPLPTCSGEQIDLNKLIINMYSVFIND